MKDNKNIDTIVALEKRTAEKGDNMVDIVAIKNAVVQRVIEKVEKNGI